MKTRIKVLSLAALLVAAAVGVVAAQPRATSKGDAGAGWGGSQGPGDHGMGPMMGMWGRHGGGRMLGPEGRLLRGGGPLAEKLSLTDAQRQKLSDIGDGLARQAIRSRADLALARLDLAKLARSESATQTALDAKVDALTRIQGTMMKAGIAARFEVRKVLTAEQRRQLDEMRKEGPPRMREFRRGAMDDNDESEFD